MLDTIKRYTGKIITKILYPNADRLNEKHLKIYDFHASDTIASSETIIRKAAQTDEINIIIYDISLDETEIPIDQEKLTSKTRQIFETLDEDLTLNIIYKHITADNNLHNLIRAIPINDDIHIDQLYDLDDSLTTYLDDNEYKEHVKGDNSKYVIAKYKIVDNSDCATALALESNYLNYALILKNSNEFKCSIDDTAGQICHELGHRIGIPHIPNTESPDIMSKSLIAGYIVYNLTKKLKFGPESRHIWNNIKKRHKSNWNNQNKNLPPQ